MENDQLNDDLFEVEAEQVINMGLGYGGAICDAAFDAVYQRAGGPNKTYMDAVRSSRRQLLESSGIPHQEVSFPLSPDIRSYEKYYLQVIQNPLPDKTTG